MQIAFTYDKKLVIQALRFHFITRPEIKLLLIIINVFAILSAAFFFFKKVSPFAFLVSSLLWVVLMAVFWFILPKSVYKKASTFREHFVMTLNDSRIFLETERGYTEWPWDKFSTWIESPHFIHLYFDSRSFFLLPKQPISEAGLLQEVRQLLQQNINKK